MKTIIPLLLTLVLAPALPATAQSGSGQAGSFSQLQSWSPAGPVLDSIPVPEAVPANDGGFDKSAANRLCCTSSEQCGRVKKDGLRTLGADSSDLEAALLTFRAITQSRWYVTFPDGRPLTDGGVGSLFITRKSFIGAYMYDLPTMSVNVTWNADPSVNLPKGGAFSQKISSLCFAPDRITVTTRLGTVGVGTKPRSVTIMPSPNSGTSAPVTRTGYMLLTDYGQYLFSSDGKNQ